MAAPGAGTGRGDRRAQGPAPAHAGRDGEPARPYPREIEDARKYAVTGFARDLLEVGDNLGRALASVPAEAREQSEFVKNLVQGVEMTERSLQAALEKHQVRRVAPQPGREVRPQAAPGDVRGADRRAGAGTVAEVMQAGYVIADRLLRPALVGVAKAAARTAAGQRGRTVDTSA